jgi:hypothetical protein
MQSSFFLLLSVMFSMTLCAVVTAEETSREQQQPDKEPSEPIPRKTRKEYIVFVLEL